MTEQATATERALPPGLEVPDWFDERATECWRLVVGLIGHTLLPIDQFPLTRYCWLWSRWRKIDELWRNKQAFTTFYDSEQRPFTHEVHPMQNIAHECATQLLDLEEALGMTPMSRARIRAALAGDDGLPEDLD
jgi:P27 family predicted phage terminase small subunit